MVRETDEMDSLELMTYFIAALGVIVLCLCVVVASILIYHFCRLVSASVSASRGWEGVYCLTVSNIVFLCLYCYYYYYYFHKTSLLLIDFPAQHTNRILETVTQHTAQPGHWD